MTIYWRLEAAPVDYAFAVQEMETRVAEIQQGRALEEVWLLEHPPLYTGGTSAKSTDLLDTGGFPVYQTGRGGQYTYHGPGQRVGYVMLDLKRRARDVRQYVCALEEWLILSLKELGVQGERRSGRVGIWVDVEGTDKKIAALGVRLKQWVSYHGVALNVSPNLEHFKGIVPCGLSQFGVTSLADLGIEVDMLTVDEVLKRQWEKISFLSL